MDILDKFLDDLEKTFAYIREREGGDSVCGLCEYDGAYIGESGDWCNECPGFNKDDCFKLSDEIRKKWKAQVATDINVGDTISRKGVFIPNITVEKFRNASLLGVEDLMASGEMEDISLLSAQPEPKWIPCSERLPEESGYYIITAHDGVGHRTTFVKYQKKAKSWDLNGARSYWRVIAWMPLPEPYQEGEQDG